MQNLKFRAWDKENKEWLYFVITPRKEDIESTISFGSRIHTYLRTSGRIEDKYYQYIGTEDKNGKEIYVGDILKDDVGDILEVKFGKLPLGKSGDCVCSYKAFYCKNYGRLGFSPINECEDIGNWMEIIGNIFENPEIINQP